MNQINLNLQKTSTIDLKNISKITLYGNYKGDRLKLVNWSNTHIIFKDGFISTTHLEDALVFVGSGENCSVFAENFVIKNGGITFWDKLTNVCIANFKILFPHTGIRFTQDHSHQKVSIINNTIIGASHEGIYCRISKATSNPCNLILIAGNNNY